MRNNEEEKWIKEPKWNDVKVTKKYKSNNSELIKEMKKNLTNYK